MEHFAKKMNEILRVKVIQMSMQLLLLPFPKPYLFQSPLSFFLSWLTKFIFWTYDTLFRTGRATHMPYVKCLFDSYSQGTVKSTMISSFFAIETITISGFIGFQTHMGRQIGYRGPREIPKFSLLINQHYVVDILFHLFSEVFVRLLLYTLHSHWFGFAFVCINP